MAGRRESMKRIRRWSETIKRKQAGFLAVILGMMVFVPYLPVRIQAAPDPGTVVTLTSAYGDTGLGHKLYCIDKGIAIDDMSLEELKAVSPVFEADIYDAISMDTCVNKRLTVGAPGKEAMEKVIGICKDYMKENAPAQTEK